MTDYNAYCASVGAKPRQIVSAVSAEFPKFSKIQFSMCANPAYGVCLLPEAEGLLVSTFGNGPGLNKPVKPHPKNTDNRKKANSFRVRLDDDTAKRVRQLMATLGYTSVQRFLEQLLLDTLARKETAA